MIEIEESPVKVSNSLTRLCFSDYSLISGHREVWKKGSRQNASGSPHKYTKEGIQKLVTLELIFQAESEVWDYKLSETDKKITYYLHKMHSISQAYKREEGVTEKEREMRLLIFIRYTESFSSTYW